MSGPEERGAPCPAHPLRASLAACAVCRRPLCELCRGQIDATDFCPTHFTIEEEKIYTASYGLPPLPAPVTIPELLVGIWAVLGAVSPWLAWYRTLVRTQQPAPVVSVIEETGWSAGGIAALASLALLVTGITLGIMVGLRTVRAGWIPRDAVVHTSLGLGATAAALLTIRIGTRYENLSTGIYLAATAAGLVIVLGRKLARVRETESPRR